MELKLNNLNDAKIKSTGGKTIQMGFSSKANAMLFDMFTDGIYANPIGSLVREVTSNCFDSHIEAEKESPSNPVIVAHTYDTVTKDHFISFIDKGVGMSPERVEKVYGQYFESTKRDGNDQIGGFGIGGKSPMAYRRAYTDENGDVQEDSSFSVVTRYNGIEYQYSIYKGKEAPEINLMFETSTTEVNGTEVRVPIRECDLDQFIREIKRQLYYFENIVYTGFDTTTSDFLNTYNIYKGKDFLYRGDVYNNEIHLCIGKVAYPISYSNLGINKYDYDIPIALKFDIGDIDVTPNREEVRYTQNTIQKIKDKLDVVKKELATMIGKQYENVLTIEDYYNAKENFGYLQFEDQKQLYLGRWIKKSDINYANFKYNELPYIPGSKEILKFFYNVHEYGKTRGNGRNVHFDTGNEYDYDSVYHCTGEFQRKIIKQSYLGHEHDKNFIILKPYLNLLKDEDTKQYEKILLNFGICKDANAHAGWGTPLALVDEMPRKEGIKLLKALQKDIAEWVSNNTVNYDDIEVPQDFIDARKQERLSKEILNTTIPLGDAARYGNKTRIAIKNLIEFKGRIFWAENEHESTVRAGADLFKSLFTDKHVDRLSYRNSFNNGKGIVFVTVAKGNAKYLRMCPNAYDINLLYPMMLRRKMVNPMDIKTANEFVSKWDNVQSIYRNKEVGVINAKLGKYQEEVRAEVKELQKYSDYKHVSFSHSLISKYIDPNKTKSNVIIKTEKQLQYILDMQEKNKDLLKWIDIPYYAANEDLASSRYDGLVELLKKVMVF